MHKHLIALSKLTIVVFTTYCVFAATSWWATILWVAAGVALSHYIQWYIARERELLMARLSSLFNDLEARLSNMEPPNEVESLVKNAIEKASRHED